MITIADRGYSHRTEAAGALARQRFQYQRRSRIPARCLAVADETSTARSSTKPATRRAA